MAGERKRILIPGTAQIISGGIGTLNQREFPSPGARHDLLFACNGVRDVAESLEIDRAIALSLCCQMRRLTSLVTPVYRVPLRRLARIYT